MFSGFREFIMRGNVVDLAVGLVIGLAFAGVINSFVADILTPLLGLLGVPDFSALATTLPSGATINWGLFLNAVIAFLIVAVAIYFIVVKPMNMLEERRQRGTVETPTTKTCTECTSEIPYAARRCPMCTQPQVAEAAPRA